jgi:hypothetical protein|uniref:Putative site-specific DNA endonuclease n=1 Tax=Oltmannsiellopsis viridis TaxID=51324 RepID=Q20ET9_OLTVI|nr:putative site-specific DNA endonuclease [Oltmannsiellopsis viridis]YP_635906.1 putative site-specific DNA endonuclease [Oltmannsiellopsis viridis]ABB81974.1 putative site-specific DNA endonuclease [Oltmannsiellopsis viridis]ABB82017.1 putative site-specific DNA endonuclease [Oltmannsiellopsis viridis]
MTQTPIDFVEYDPIRRSLQPAQSRQYCKSLPPLTPVQKEIIAGIMLGDGSMMTRGQEQGPQNQIRFEQRARSREYVEQVYMKFRDFVSKPPEFAQPKGQSTSNEGSYVFKTYARDCFRYYAQQFYYKDKQRLRNPPNYRNDKPWRRAVPNHIHRMLTERSLAYWFMDDGSWTRSGLYLNTQCFEREGDQQKLISALKTCFDLRATKQRDGTHYRLAILAADHDKFYQLVRPYIYSCFEYKFEFYLNKKGM